MTTSRDLQRDNLLSRALRVMNLRSEESGRTFWMFLSYAATSVGVLWLEAAASALFLEQYSADNLPLIYLSSTVLSIFLGFLYGLVQSIIPLRWVIVLVSVMMALPVLAFQQGLILPAGATIGGFVARSEERRVGKEC